MKWITKHLPSRPPQGKWGKRLWWFAPFPWMYTPEPYQPPEVSLAEIAKKELPRLRQRGISYVDLKTHNQQPLSLPNLDELARAYVGLRLPEFSGDRFMCLHVLILSAVRHVEKYGSTAQTGQFVRALFFDPDDPAKPAKPAVLLSELKKTIRNAHGDPLSEDDFARLRRREFEEFARWIVSFVNEECGKFALQEKKAIMWHNLLVLAFYAVLVLGELWVAVRYS